MPQAENLLEFELAFEGDEFKSFEGVASFVLLVLQGLAALGVVDGSDVVFPGFVWLALVAFALRARSVVVAG